MIRLSALLVAVLALRATPGQQPWEKMDFGPFLSGTIGGPDEANVAVKGIAIWLGKTRDAGVLFDTELLRLVSAWAGDGLRLTGTAYDGAHGPFPRVRGREQARTPVEPGVARGQSFADPRPIPYGPLPREHGRYRGLYLHGDRVVLAYDAMGTPILETHGLVEADADRAILRTLEVGASEHTIRLLVNDTRGGEGGVADNHAAYLERAPTPRRVMAQRAESFAGLDIGPPSRRDWADAASRHGAAFTWVDGFIPPGAAAAALARLNDGEGRGGDERGRSVVFEGSDARFVADLGQTVEIARLHTYSRQRGRRVAQAYTLFASDRDVCPGAGGKDPGQDGWVEVARADTQPLGEGGVHGVGIANPDGTSLGRWRWLLFVMTATPGGTSLGEVDVWASGEKPEIKARTDMLTATSLLGAGDRARLDIDGQRLVVDVLPRPTPLRLQLLYWRGPLPESGAVGKLLAALPPAEDLTALTKGGPPRWSQEVVTRGAIGQADGAWALDTLTAPDQNPWHSWLRFAGLDFFPDGQSAALSTWNGDVWIVSGIDETLERLVWRRFATGLFDPLGLKIVGGVVHTHGRDQITRLHDLNGDGEADFYECFNNEVYATPAFHEFAFDLHTDPDGNFLFSKGGPVNPGGRGFMKLVPHHGTILKLSKDGRDLSVYATGFRAPTGIGVGPNGEVTSGDNEGTWMPRCRLSWVQPKSFNGCVSTAQRDSPPQTYDPPLCWLPFEVDNSSGSQVWVPPGGAWPFPGELLHLSYGQCRVFKVLKEVVGGQVQGGIVRLPVTFASGCLRARFNPTDGQLYVCGLKGWQTRAARDTALQRLRWTGKPVHLPAAVRVTKRGLHLTFTDELDAETANDPDSWAVEQWNYLWTQDYGSPEVSALDPKKVDRQQAAYDRPIDKPTARDSVRVASAKLLPDGKTVFLEIPDIRPVMQMHVAYNVDAKDGTALKSDVWLTIHKLGDEDRAGR